MSLPAQQSPPAVGPPHLSQDPLAAGMTERLARAPSLAGTPRTARELPGGLTNRNYHVSTPDGEFVARVWAAGDNLLAIDRDREYANSVIAAEAGVGAPVFEYRPDDCMLVIGYLPGRTYTSADVADPANTQRIAAACRQLHAARRFAGDFDMFAIQGRYTAVTAELGFRVPRGYDRYWPQFAAAQAALAVRDEGTVPCNNDLLAGNFIDDGERIWLIDYEYSGNNDPCFELGNIAAESGLSADALAALVTAYYGRPRRSRIARAQLFGLVARYGWTLWGAIQAASSPLEFDFWSWAMEKYEAAAAGFSGPGYARLLGEVQIDDARGDG
ncbi:MAG: phosphotransferase [Streptosporangiaceae bacterium]